MAHKLLIKNAQLVNEGKIFQADVYVENGIICGIDNKINKAADETIDATGLYLLPGIIDDQVHFREPGLTHKADIQSEARAGVAGGVTSFMEMPNTNPPTLSQLLLEEKYKRAAKVSLSNYSFFMGVSNDNLTEALKTDRRTVCGLKIFMGSSTGNMLVDKRESLEAIFAQSPLLIATHCEDEQTIRSHTQEFQAKYGDQIPMEAHPEIRNAEACYLSSHLAIELAKTYHTRLHILHISTADELPLFDNTLPLNQKRITAEVCVHHLSFSSDDYPRLGTQLKCNPAIKAPHHRTALWKGLLDNHLDIIATDHAPHTWEEKQNFYTKAPSGVPLVQHSFNLLLEAYHEGKISLERIVEKMCHAPAICFQIEKRGFLAEGYHADMFLVDLHKKWTVTKQNIFYKCQWSPLEQKTFQGKVTHTFVNGNWVYFDGKFDERSVGKRLLFEF